MSIKAIPLLKALQLGNKTFSTNLIQGPLAGISCAPFRRLIWDYSQPAFTCTEMISCKALLHKPLAAQQRYVKKDNDEGAVCFQLSSSDPAELGEATKRVTEYGADLIDLNCGCPVKKIRRKGAGSSLLVDTAKLYQLISAMKQNTHLPVSIKIRVQSNSTEKFNQEVANVVRDAGADFLTVHGRHWTEHYETPCNYPEIEFFVRELQIPVIGNGDVACLDSLKKMFATGCAGVMIGRAGIGQPWLIQKLVAEMTAKDFTPPSIAEIGFMFIQHTEGLIDLLQSEKFAIFQARRLAKHYARLLTQKREFYAAITQCENLQTLKKITQDYFSMTVT